MVGGFWVGGRFGTMGAARDAPPGRPGIKGAIVFAADSTWDGLIPNCCIPEFTWFIVFMVDLAWAMWLCAELIVAAPGRAGGFFRAWFLLGGNGADFATKRNCY